MRTTPYEHPEIYGTTPGCFTDSEWKQWKVSELRFAANKVAAGEHGFCAACTERYKRRMVRAGKCRHENVVFVRDDDDCMTGVRPDVGPVSKYNDGSTSEGA